MVFAHLVSILTGFQASVGAAAAVILRAFHERPNFYSATVYLGQSTACRMILLNMLLLTLGTSIYALQRLLYGRLRAIEIEQLWDRAWYAITETALAMTTFRDEVGGYFFLMFMTLLAAKVWGWIGEGRVETLEQQPPTNPRTFYTRLTASLILSVSFDLLMARYCLRTILDQRPPRAGMMIMFVFEFVILAIVSTSTLARFMLAGYEKHIVNLQTKAKIQERREEIRAERAATLAQEATGDDASRTTVNQARVDDIEVDENEIDVPGWQEKGKWILFLDLTTGEYNFDVLLNFINPLLSDFLKLLFYVGFFMVLILFAGIPIHMFRDLFITTRSFLKRINDYFKYRNATRDMNSRYADATEEELRRDGICIICREEMRPWQAPPPNDAENENQQRTRPAPDERQRPKTLPCGHILHFGCLRSWLERQQVCPTCRRSVLAPDPTRQPAPNRNGQHMNNRGDQPNANEQGGHPGQQQPRPPQQQQHPDIDRVRTLNFGPLRLTFAAGRGNIGEALDQVQNQANRRQDRGRPENGNSTNNSSSSRGTHDTASTLSDDLRNVEQRILREMSGLSVAQRELYLLRAMQGELSRLRSQQANESQDHPPLHNVPNINSGVAGSTTLIQQQNPHSTSFYPALESSISEQQVHQAQDSSSTIGPGDANLPQGMVLPEGWLLLPLHPMGENMAPEPAEEVLAQAPHPSAGSQPSSSQHVPIPPSSSVPESRSVNANSTAQDGFTTGVAVDGPLHNTSTPDGPFENTEPNSTVNGLHEASENNETIAESASPNIPQWATTSSRAVNRRSEASVANPNSVPSSANQVNGSANPTSPTQSPPNKGKGRAATVEDVQEDE